MAADATRVHARLWDQPGQAVPFFNPMTSTFRPAGPPALPRRGIRQPRERSEAGQQSGDIGAERRRDRVSDILVRQCGDILEPERRSHLPSSANVAFEKRQPFTLMNIAITVRSFRRGNRSSTTCFGGRFTPSRWPALTATI
jgi:hypothetical protein